MELADLGYSTVDAPPQDTKYSKGLVAMAKAGNEPSGTSGSQFFVVTGANVPLSTACAVLGNVTDGLDVVEKIGTLGDPNDPNGAPTERIEIKRMELQSSCGRRALVLLAVPLPSTCGCRSPTRRP